MTEPIHPCAACVHFDAQRSDLASLGFGKCDQLPAWRQVSRQAQCAFNPSRWSPRHEENPARANDRAS